MNFLRKHWKGTTAGLITALAVGLGVVGVFFPPAFIAGFMIGLTSLYVGAGVAALPLAMTTIAVAIAGIFGAIGAIATVTARKLYVTFHKNGEEEHATPKVEETNSTESSASAMSKLGASTTSAAAPQAPTRSTSLLSAAKPSVQDDDTLQSTAASTAGMGTA